MSKKWIEPLSFDASVRVNGTAMTAADNMIEAANALEIATARIDAYTKELGGCRNAVGFGSADDPMAQEGFDALGDPLCVAAFVESQFKRIVAERDALAAELTALREQEPVATVETSGDKGGCIAWAGVRIDVGVKLYARPTSPRISATHREEADEAIRNALGEALDCESSWREGEMKRRDFMPVACCDDRVASIRNAAFSVFDRHLPDDRLADRFIRDCAFKHGLLQEGADINPDVMEFAREIEAASLSINGIESALFGGELQSPKGRG